MHTRGDPVRPAPGELGVHIVGAPGDPDASIVFVLAPAIDGVLVREWTRDDWTAPVERVLSPCESYALLERRAAGSRRVSPALPAIRQWLETMRP